MWGGGIRISQVRMIIMTSRASAKKDHHNYTLHSSGMYIITCVQVRDIYSCFTCRERVVRPIRSLTGME